MSEPIYEISRDMGDDPQTSQVAMYRDMLPQRHRIDEIDDEAPRDIFHWMHEEDWRETDAYKDPLVEESYFEEQEEEEG